MDDAVTRRCCLGQALDVVKIAAADLGACRVDGGGGSVGAGHPYYYFVDRLKDYIRRKGENVSSFEVEKFVVAHPSVIECAALGVPAELGEDEVKIVIVTSEGFAADPEELYAHLEAVMPRYMVPRYIDYVEELPKTPATGRVRKGELKKGYVSTLSWDREQREGADARSGPKR
jgi:crotonobetaine/carnitine-CoA ligase